MTSKFILAQSIDPKIIQEAVNLARGLSCYCVEHKFPRDTEIYGIAIDADAVRKKAFEAGREFERKRIEKFISTWRKEG